MRSCSEASGYNVDLTLGGLVWVQRRNGSWWPGQILCLDELPKNCLASPRRSGVPVKLLGREDVSLEWYNLEKSKRVKPFRCGEYEECIEKAKVTAAVSRKKARKYAHREDAILQALQIENFQLSEHNNPDTTSQIDKNGNVYDKWSGLELSRSGASADDSLDCSRQRTPNDSEDDGTEGSMKRMRGLEDFGIGKASPSFKKKRSRVVHIHDFLKKKYRRRQLTKVLKKSEIVTVPVMFEELTGLDGSDSDANDCKPKENENSSNSELRDDDSSRLFDVPFIREGKLATGSSPALVPEMGRVSTEPQLSQSSPVETASVESDEFQESGSISSGADINQITDNGTSKWQNKGKRNSRKKNKTKTVQKILDLDYELRKVNGMVDPTAQQRSMPVRQSRSKKSYTGSLYDVSIEVKAGRFTQHLPYVSLLSNLTGQRITGHLLEVDVLKDTDSECLSSRCELSGVNNVDEDVEMVPRHSKRQRRNGLSSNKKIRRLSSLTTCKKPSETGTLKRPDLACVPLKVVFGRIYAALGITVSIPADAAPAQ